MLNDAVVSSLAEREETTGASQTRLHFLEINTRVLLVEKK